jgi:hypothetical protein
VEIALFPLEKCFFSLRAAPKKKTALELQNARFQLFFTVQSAQSMAVLS